MTTRAVSGVLDLLPRGRARKPVLGMVMALPVFLAFDVAVLASGQLTSATLPPVASASRAAPGSAVPGPVHASPSPTPRPVAEPAPGSAMGFLRHGAPTPTQAPAPSPQHLALITFQNGTDGWMQEWGNISLTPATQPAFDGASLVLTTTSSTSGVGTASDGATNLKAGDTVTYHVWSSGQPGSVQPLVADDNNEVTFTGSAALPSTPGWFTLTWTVPSTPPLEGIGLQITNPYDEPLTLAIGELTWPEN